MGDSSKSSGLSRLRPPKIIALKKRPGTANTTTTTTTHPPSAVPTLTKKSCLKPAPPSGLLGQSSPSTSSGASSTASSSSSSPGVSSNAVPGSSSTLSRPVKSVQIKTSHNLVKLVRPNSGTHSKPNQPPRESLTSTFRELFRDFPANAAGSVSVLSGARGRSNTTAAATKPPPYRNPPPPVSGNSRTSSLKRPAAKNPLVDTYDEIEIDTSQTLGRRKGVVQSQPPSWKEKDSKEKRSNSLTGTLPRKAPPNNYVIFKTISEIRTTRAEVNATQDGVPVSGGKLVDFPSDRFQNIPVKPRKSGGAMQRLENYCLFDPSVDFISEKDDPHRVSYSSVSGGGGGSLRSDPVPAGLRNYETIEPGPSNFIAETDLYILDSLTDAMYGQSIGLSGLSTPQLPGTPQSARSSGLSTPVGLNSGQVTVGSNDRYIQVINHRKLLLVASWEQANRVSPLEG